MIRFYFLLIFSLCFLPACAEPSGGTIVLPDLPEPAQFDSSLVGLQNGGMQLKGSFDDERFFIKPELSNAKGVPLETDLVSQKIPETTVGWMLSSRPDKTEAVMNIGWRAGSNQQLLFSAAQLHGTFDVDTDSKAVLNQTIGGLNYRYFIDRSWLSGIELSGYTSESQGLNFQAENQQRSAVGNLVGMRLGLEASPLPDAKLKLGFGGERLAYDSLSGLEPQQNLNTSIRWSQILMPSVKYNALFEGKGAERIIATGLDINLYNGQQLGVKLARTQWNDGQAADNLVQLTYRMQFGKKFVPFQFRGDNAPWNANLANEVLQRPGYLPKSVLSSPN